MAAVMAVKSIRQVSQGERLLAPSVANTSQSNGNQKQVAKFSLPMIKKYQTFLLRVFRRSSSSETKGHTAMAKAMGSLQRAVLQCASGGNGNCGSSLHPYSSKRLRADDNDDS